MSCICRGLPWSIFVQGLARVHGLESSYLRGAVRAVPRSATQGWLVEASWRQRAFHLTPVPRLAEASGLPEGKKSTPTGTWSKTSNPSISSSRTSPATSSKTWTERPQTSYQNRDNSKRAEGNWGSRVSTDRRTESARPWKAKSDYDNNNQRKGNGDVFKKRDEEDPIFPKREKEPWMIQKEALKAKFPEGWKPRKRLSPDALIGIRALHAQFPDIYTTEALAGKFKVSAEAIRRILKSNFRPDATQEAERRERWERRGLQVWERKAALGIKPPRKWREAGIMRDPSHRERVMRASQREKQLEEEEIRTYQEQYLQRRARELKSSGTGSSSGSD
ncbi:hypothetical protein XA68_14164 [Ophiocordyceps unilateralis]|uniref:Required for respiratory growth protein 9, mitochondrial n=1 Tax=Ophiocordyceps unilateralis TaxID=268505 RepID=A0A2A9PM60_OPHUN|nr:hypothetical protein XA68_14164 [Ophiocordyceps unilateralis]